MVNGALLCLGPIFYMSVLFLLPYAKAVIMTRMSWAPMGKSFKHAFWINISLILVLYLDITFWNTDKIIFNIVFFFSPAISPDVWLPLSQIIYFLFLIVLATVVEATILTVLLFTLNKSEPYRRAWLIAAINNTLSIIWLSIFAILFVCLWQWKT